MYRYCTSIFNTFAELVKRVIEEMSQRCTVNGESTRRYSRFNATGTQLTVRLLQTPPNSDPITHFLDSMFDMFEYALGNSDGSDMVDVTISNEVNMQDKPIGISFRRRDQLSSDVIWSLFENVAQSNARFNAMDKLIIVVRSVEMPVEFGHTALKNQGRQPANIAHLKRSIIEVRAENNCLSHASIIAKARADGHPYHQSFRKGNKILPVVASLLEEKGIDVTHGGGIPELIRFQKNFHEYKIVVYDSVHCDNIIYEGHVESPKRINLLYDDVNRHYHVITNLTGIWRNDTCVEPVIRGARMALGTHANGDVAIV